MTQEHGGTPEHPSASAIQHTAGTRGNLRATAERLRARAAVRLELEAECAEALELAERALAERDAALAQAADAGLARATTPEAGDEQDARSLRAMNAALRKEAAAAYERGREHGRNEMRGGRSEVAQLERERDDADDMLAEEAKARVALGAERDAALANAKKAEDAIRETYRLAKHGQWPALVAYLNGYLCVTPEAPQPEHGPGPTGCGMGEDCGRWEERQREARRRAESGGRT